MMNPRVRIVKSTTEDCPQAGRQCLTLYFEGAPTIKQIMHTAKALRKAHRVCPNLSSRNLRVYSKFQAGMVRCQVVD